MSLREKLEDRMPRKCAQCGRIIRPRDGIIWTMGENVYCTKWCAVESMGVEAHFLFNEDYLDYFPKKSEDLFAREEADEK